MEEVIMGWILVIPWYLPEETGENHEKPQQVCGIRLNQGTRRATHSVMTSAAVARQQFIVYLTSTTEYVLSETLCSHVKSLSHAIHLYVCLDCTVNDKSIFFTLQAQWWMVRLIFAFTFWPRTSFLMVSDNLVNDQFCKWNICDGNC